MMVKADSPDGMRARTTYVELKFEGASVVRPVVYINPEDWVCQQLYEM